MISDLSGINLNLLFVLHVLLTEKHVTKASVKLKLRQSTVSGSLKQLRILFDDELLVRGYSNKMYLTQKAKQLQEPVRKAVEYINKVFISEQAFDPKVAETTFTIGMSDYVETMLLVKLIKYVKETAPNIKLIVKHLNDLNNYKTFENENLDLAIGNFNNTLECLEKECLFSDTFVVFAKKGHPIFNEDLINFEVLRKYDLLRIKYRKMPNNYFYDLKAAEMSLQHVSVTVQHMTVGMDVVKSSDFVSFGPRKMLEKYEDIQYRSLLSTSYENQFDIYQYWKPVDNHDIVHTWLRNAIKMVTNKLI
ncbi:MAG TPA: LysR substrate-binding domain-containing protein [Victivallales bacterium]|nr:LysR substrate-binding domain-containing protein [Victivallales bacterium]